MPNTILGPRTKCSVQLTAAKNTKYLKNQTILKIDKIGHEAKATALQNGQFKWKIKITKTMPKTVLRPRRKCAVQKTAAKNTKYLKNQTILEIGKIGHEAKAIAFAKWSVWVEN